MKRLLSILVVCILVALHAHAQQFPKMDTRNYISDSLQTPVWRPWLAVGEVLGINMGVWAVDRYIGKADFAYINFKTIKHNFKTGPVWDTDMFSTNLFAHPYHGSLYFNAARSNGMNFWQSMPFTTGGSLMWEFFMENEPPSINDLMATSLGGVALGEITYRLSDLFIDQRATGAERVGRELLTGFLSPVRGLNRLITGEAWKHRRGKGRAFSKVPINFMVNLGSRFLAHQETSNHGAPGMQLTFRLDYGDPFSDPAYSPYEWFQVKAGLDFFSGQPLISQFNTVGALWGKQIFARDERTLSFGVFQHFDYYDSQKIKGSDEKRVPYRISEAVAAGPGFLYNKRATPVTKTDVFGELYLNGIGLGASISDYYKEGERDYNMGSGYSVKMFTGLVYDKRIAFMLHLENYHIFTWKGYKRDLDWSNVEPGSLNTQGDPGNARLAVLTANLSYFFKNRWHISFSNRYFQRKTHYRYYDEVKSSNYDVALSIGVRI